MLEQNPPRQSGMFFRHSPLSISGFARSLITTFDMGTFCRQDLQPRFSEQCFGFKEKNAVSPNRVARFFSVQHTKTGKIIDKMTTECTKWTQNSPFCCKN
jgi:hypothetical protein